MTKIKLQLNCKSINNEASNNRRLDTNLTCIYCPDTNQSFSISANVRKLPYKLFVWFILNSVPSLVSIHFISHITKTMHFLIDLFHIQTNKWFLLSIIQSYFTGKSIEAKEKCNFISKSKKNDDDKIAPKTKSKNQISFLFSSPSDAAWYCNLEQIKNQKRNHSFNVVNFIFNWERERERRKKLIGWQNRCTTLFNVYS